MSQRGRHSQSGTADARSAKEAFERKVNELVQYYIMRMRAPCGPIKRTEIVKDVLGDEFSKDFLDLNEAATKRLRDTFGIVVHDLDALEKKAAGNKTFLLSNRLHLSNDRVELRLDRDLPNELTNEKRGLLKFVLCVLRAYGGETSEANVIRALTRIGVFGRNDEHPRFGDAKKLFEEFRKAGYIDMPNGAFTASSDGSQMVRFGARTRLEFDERANKELLEALGIRSELRTQQ